MEIALSQVFPVNHPLSERVLDVESLELLRRPPVVVPDHELRLVPKAVTGSQPSIAEIQVLCGYREPLVESAYLKDRSTIANHVVRKEPIELAMARVVPRMRLYVYRRHAPGVSCRAHLTGHDGPAITRYVAECVSHPCRIHSAVVVRHEDDVVRRLRKSDVPRTTNSSLA